MQFRLTRRPAALVTAAALILTASAVAIRVSAVSAAPLIRTGAVSAGVGFHAAALTPTTNITPNPPYPSACQTTPTSATCQNAGIAALNNARAVMGLPAYSLPANFQSMSAANQFLILSNLDRSSYGLTQITGLNTALNAAAADGVATDSDPAGPSVVEGARFTAWTANWAAGWASPLYTYYEWMYDDGYPGANADCPTSTSAGCWGHRRSTLYNFGSSKVYMGAATGTSPQYHAPAFTELYMGFSPAATISSTGPTPNGSPATCLGSSTGGANASTLLGGSLPVGTPMASRRGDLVAIDGNAMPWYYQNGGGTTPYSSRTSAASSAMSSFVKGALGDVNGDGHADMIATGSEGGLWYYLGDGTSSPFGSGGVQIGSTGWAAFNWIGLGDVDGDGRADLLATSPDGRLWYYQNNGTNTPFITPSVIGNGWTNPATLSVGDINGDGKADLLTATSDGRLQEYLNNGTDNPYPTATTIGASGWQNFNRIYLNDVDGDGRADVIATSADGRLWNYQNNNTATPYTSATVIGASGWQNYPTLLAGDIHGGRSGDLVGTRPDGSLWYYQNNGTTTPYVGLGNVGTGGWQNFDKITLGDLNGDGLADLVATSGDGRLWYYPNTNTCSPYSRPFIIGTGGWQNFTRILLGDVNGDGLADLIATSTDGRLWYYQNNGTGTPYITPTIIGAAGWQNFNRLLLGDVNGDGKADLIATSTDGRLWYYQNNGTTTPYPTPTIISTSGWQNFDKLTLTDVNGDGKTDLIATSGDGRLWYYQNNGTTTPYPTPNVIWPYGWQAYNRLF